MKRSLILLILAFFGFGQMSAQVSGNPTKTFDAEMLMSIKRISDPQVSPDGQWVLYRLSTPLIDENKFVSDLYIVAVDGSRVKQITDDEASDYNARWSPDGKEIAFISTRDGTPQIFRMKFPSGEPKKITEVENGVSNMLWSPDGKYFSFTSEVKMEPSIEDKYPKYSKANVRIYKDLPVRHWDEWTDNKYSHLFIVPTNGGDPVDLLKDEKNDVPLKPFGGVKEIAWAPDSKQIAYTSKKVQDPEMSTNSDIYLVNLENGKPTGRHINITQGMEGFDKQPQYSPDGKYIAFHSQERAGFESDRIRLMLHDRKTFDNFDLTSTFDNWVSEKIWAPDSKTIYFTAGTKGTVQIFKMSVPDGKWDVVTDGWYNYGQGMDITPDGTELIFGRQSMVHALDIWKMKLADGVISRLTDINQQIYKDLKLPEIKEKWITSTDGAKVHCWVIYPPDFHESNEYPMITYCQGGPQAMIGQRFHFRWNWYLMASKGYVVLCPNRRGVPGFGQEWNDAISMDWGGLPMDDIMAATDAMTIEKYIDRERVAAIGASAGGYAAFWLAGNHEGRYAAFLAHCGVFNLESMYGSTEELWFPNWEYGGPYWEDRKNYEQNSPHRFARNWDTPIVISTGERDYRVPYTQSLEAFTVAQVKGIDSKLLVYPEETHFIASPQEYIIWDNEVFDFLDKYCK